MAWLKLKPNLDRKIEFSQLSSALGLGREATLFRLYWLASWFSVHAKYGKLPMRLNVIDSAADCPGLSAALLEIGWLVEGNGNLMLASFCDVSSSRKAYGKAIRREMLHGAVCANCMALENLVIDHIVPISRGGSCERENLQALCFSCNAKKGRMTMEEFIAA